MDFQRPKQSRLKSNDVGLWLMVKVTSALMKSFFHFGGHRVEFSKMDEKNIILWSIVDKNEIKIDSNETKETQQSFSSL